MAAPAVSMLRESRLLRHRIIRRLARFPALHPWLVAWEEAAHFAPIIDRERSDLRAARTKWGGEYRREGDPLVSVVIATWNRGPLLAERTIPSVLEQSYQNFEIVIVGDCCTDESQSLLGNHPDPRVRFINLEKRGDYPELPFLRYCVAGTVPINEAFRQARGLWVAHLDDDDTWTPDHLEALLRKAQREDLEMVYGVIRRERSPGDWVERGDPDFTKRVCLGSATLIRTYVARAIPLDMDAWRVVWGGDKHRWRRMAACGVRVGFLDRVIAYSPLRPEQRTIAHLAEDREGSDQVRKLKNVLDLL